MVKKGELSQDKSKEERIQNLEKQND